MDQCQPPFLQGPGGEEGTSHTDHIDCTRSTLESDGTNGQDGPAPVDRICPHVLDRGTLFVLHLAVKCLLHVFDLIFDLSLSIRSMPEQGLERCVSIPVFKQPPGRLGYEKKTEEHESGDYVDESEWNQVGVPVRDLGGEVVDYGPHQSSDRDPDLKGRYHQATVPWGYRFLINEQ